MKGSSKVIVGATLIMVVCLALVLGLVLVLLAELYCSLLFRRRKLWRPTTISSNMPTTVTSFPVPAATSNVYDRQHQEEQHSVPPPSLSSFYAHGVLHAPRSFLFPSVHVVNSNYHLQDLEKQQKHYSLGSLFGDESQTRQLQLPSMTSSSSSCHEFIAGHAFSLPPSPTTFIPVASPPVIVQYCSGDDEVRGENENNNYIYICNPIYDNNDGNNMPVVRVDDTPFETPDSSPSRLETMGSSGEEDDHDDITTHPSSSTPPLTTMKKLPAAGCSSSVSLKRNTRSSLATSVSDSNNSINIYGKSSSSSSGSLCTSPSW